MHRKILIALGGGACCYPAANKISDKVLGIQNYLSNSKNEEKRQLEFDKAIIESKIDNFYRQTPSNKEEFRALASNIFVTEKLINMKLNTVNQLLFKNNQYLKTHNKIRKKLRFDAFEKNVRMNLKN